MNMKNIVMASTTAFLVCGCASTNTIDAKNQVEKHNIEAERAIEAIRAAKPLDSHAQTSGVRRVNAVWIPFEKVSESDYRAAPALNRNVVVNRRFENLKEAASYITLLTGIPVFVSERQTANIPSTAPVAPPPMPPSIPPSQLGAMPPAAASRDITGLISYSGKLAGFLDVLAARFGVYWEPEGDGIRFFYTKSKTFRLAALPGDSSMASNIGSSSSGGGGSSSSSSGGGSSSSSSSAQLNSGISFSGLSVWKAVEDGIRTMLSPYGRVVVTPATGTITVDDVPPSLERVERYVHEQNAALTRQVVMNVRVLSVELTDSDSYGINWDVVYKNISQNLGIALSATSGLQVGTSTLSFSVVNTSSRWNGTKAVLEALSKQGRVSQITSASIVTINNQPAPIQIGRQRSYLASSTTTLGSGGTGNTTTLVPGTVTTGFSMSVMPHILDDDRMMLQYAGDISSLLDISTVSSNGSSIQTPEIDTRNFLQRVIMKNGETLVLTGFEQFDVTGQKQGIGSPNNVYFGGSVRANKNKTVLVVLIQPVISKNES